MTDDVRAQYATNSNLTKRANLHVAYSRVGWFDWLARRMALPEGAAVLDVGCGPGWMWRRMGASLAPGLRLTLLDTSSAMVKEAQAALAAETHWGSVEGVEGDALDLPFAAESFDAVVMMHMLYHVPDIPAALAEAARVLRRGGRIYTTTNTCENLVELTEMTGTVFGVEPYDIAAMIFSLDDAERLLARDFEAVTRHDLQEAYRCDDADIILDFLLSMPPANAGTPEQKSALRALVETRLESAGGVIAASKQTGLVAAIKPANDPLSDGDVR
ncbi:class I SAM-dependent methyltransferase [uncultured Roseobacter sp.]|uniref:class I SAM-dependent methyltransferase n=1 Tax=uncultured Roseobacter sp. TaxID=114847 RepID=UPI0026362CB2|nr:class I SAM-dependent methyltransferase [uncultured Roseobacter sp.]